MSHSIPSDLLDISKFNIIYEDERPQTSNHNEFIMFDLKSLREG